MEESSPVKNKHTSKVIDSLHSEIDALKEELSSVKISQESYKKNYSLALKKNELFIDQLANTKHENDMINALLKRKERRIADLEEQYTELSSSLEKMTLSSKNMKVRYENLQDTTAESVAEYERLKIAYDALNASHIEYRKHYESEIKRLMTIVKDLEGQMSEGLVSLQDKFENNEKDVETMLESLANKRKTMDTLYMSRNKAILVLLTKLAQATRSHGEESKDVLRDLMDNIKALSIKFPDLSLKLHEEEELAYNINDILNEPCETSLGSEDVFLISSDSRSLLSAHSEESRDPEKLSIKKRRNRRNLLATTSKDSQESDINVENISRRSSKREPSASRNGRILTDSHVDNQNHGYQKRNNSNGSTNKVNSKAKRRSFYSNRTSTKSTDNRK